LIAYHQRFVTVFGEPARKTLTFCCIDYDQAEPPDRDSGKIQILLNAGHPFNLQMDVLCI
jgi:hypothetical protein